MGQGLHLHARSEDVQDFANVDPGRLQQLLADAPAQFGHVLLRAHLRPAEEDVPGQGQPVAVDAARGQADDHIARSNVLPDDDLVQGHGADARPGEVEAPPLPDPLDQLPDLGDLPAGDRDVGLPRPFVEALTDGREHRRIGFLDGNVVQHGERLCPHAEEVVHVHGDTVDAHGVVFVQHLGHKELGADPVRGEGQAEVIPQVQDRGEVAEVQNRFTAAEGHGLPHPAK